MRTFYLSYQKSQTLSDELVKNGSQTLSAKSEMSNKKQQTLTAVFESVKNNWSVRELNIQYDTALFTRLTLSRNKEKVKELSTKGQVLEKPKDAIKDPYILEFIGLPENTEYSESNLK